MDILARTSSELKTAFAEAGDGDVIKLAPGDYGSVRLRNKDFDTDVTITSADPGNRAAFNQYLELNNVSGVTIEDVDVDAGSLAPAFSYSRLQVIKSQDVTLRDMSVEGHIPTGGEGANPSSASRTEAISGYGYENGVRVRWSEGVTLDDIEFSDLRQALSVSDSKGTDISNLEVRDVREGINLNDVDETLIEDSWFHDFKPFRSDHPDMIQFWGTNSGVHGLTVRDNLLDQPEGWTQSIFGHFNGRPDNVTGSDFVISGNTIINAHVNAIRIREIDGFEISDNLLLPNDPNYDYRRLPQITVLDSENGEVSGNLLLPRWNGSLINLGEGALNAANIAMTDNVALSSDSGDDLFWKNLLDGKSPNVSPPAETDSSTGDEPVSDESPQADSGGEKEPLTGDETLVDSDESVVAQPDEEGEAGTDDADEDGSEVSEPLEDEAVSEEPSGEQKHGSDQAPTPENVLSDSPAIDVSQVDLAGTGSRDWLRDMGGSTSLTGGEKGDVFAFDYRADTAEAHDVITDFDFSEGDRLVLTSGRAGTFDDNIDPGNNLLILHGGTRAHIQSANDLREAVAGGGISLEASHGGNLVLTFEDAPDRSIELLGISPDDFSI